MSILYFNELFPLNCWRIEIDAFNISMKNAKSFVAINIVQHKKNWFELELIWKHWAVNPYFFCNLQACKSYKYYIILLWYRIGTLHLLLGWCGLLGLVSRLIATYFSPISFWLCSQILWVGWWWWTCYDDHDEDN